MRPRLKAAVTSCKVMRDTSRKMDKNFPGARTNLKSDEQVLQLKGSRPLLPSKKKKKGAADIERENIYSAFRKTDANF